MKYGLPDIYDSAPWTATAIEQIVTAARWIGCGLRMILCLLLGLTGGAVMGWATAQVLNWGLWLGLSVSL